MLTITPTLSSEQEKQINTPRVDVGLRPFVTHAKNMGASDLALGSYYVTARVNQDNLYIANGTSSAIFLHRFGLSDLFTLGDVAAPTTVSVNNAFSRPGWGFSVSVGDSSVFLHYITGLSAYGASNFWTRREYTHNLATLIGTTNLANINNPTSVPLTQSNSRVPFINVVDDTLYATTHSRNSAVGGSHYYDVYYSEYKGGAWGEFTKLDGVSVHYRSIGGANDDSRASYVNVHNAGRNPIVAMLGITTTGSNESAFNTFKYELLTKEILGRQTIGNYISLDLQEPTLKNSNQVGLSLRNYTLTETSGMSQSFISVDYPRFNVVQQPLISKTWGFRGDENRVIRRSTGASAPSVAFNAHTVYYQGPSFIIDINIPGSTPSTIGVSAAITNYVGVTDFDVLNYTNSNNSTFDITASNAY